MNVKCITIPAFGAGGTAFGAGGTTFGETNMQLVY